ncbi:MAG: hypothetical protein M1835_001674 [Candelina submexicana]|nr:MAG: hypothetical protein M1835_001674 [Candelina submexicana]
MSANLRMWEQTTYEGAVEELLEIYRLHTQRYPLAEALCELSPKKALFENMMKRDLSRFQARSQDLADEEMNTYEKSFCILMTPDDDGKVNHIGGTNIYIERIMKLGTGLEKYYETLDKNIYGINLRKLDGKTTPENVALHWTLPEASSQRTNIVNDLKTTQPHDLPQLRSFEASKLLETGYMNGKMYATALSRDPRLAKLWQAYKSSNETAIPPGDAAATGGLLTKVLTKALEASRLLDAVGPCMNYLKLKNRAWLKAGIEAMMKSSVQEILAQKEEGAMMVELARAVKGAGLAINGRIDEAKAIRAKVGVSGNNGTRGTGGNGEQGARKGVIAVRKPRHRWLRRMGVDPKQGVDPTISRSHGGQQRTPPPQPPQLRRQKAFHEGKQRGITSQHRCGDDNGEFWAPFL